MTKRTIKSFACILSISLLFSSFVYAETLQDNANVITQATGLIPEEYAPPSLFETDPEFLAGFQAIQNQSTARSTTNDGLTNAVDQSESDYFPPIGDQGGAGSCASFATTYYQFTFAKNQFYDTKASFLANRCSPLYTYNFIPHDPNGDGDGDGTTISDNYKFLQMFGSLSQQTFPYGDTDARLKAWPTSSTKVREALNFRIKSTHSNTVDTTNASITHTDSYMLTQIKYLIGTGYLLVIGTHTDWYAENGIIYRSNAESEETESNKGYHAMTVVGYDDTKWLDVNKNGVKDTGETGAFKLANSWGTDAIDHEDGFIWVLYDAMNKTSQIPGDWESSYTRPRKAFFSHDSFINRFYYINVDDTKPLFIGELTFTVSAKNQANFLHKADVMGDNDTYFGMDYFPVLETENSNESAFTGKLYFPFNNKELPTSSDYNTFSCTMKIIDNNYSSTDGSIYSNVSYRIIDNLGNQIHSFGTISITSRTTMKIKSFDISTRGDVNYDGVINSTDSSTILDMAVGNIDYSNAQEFYADCNKDGKIDANDALAIM